MVCTGSMFAVSRRQQARGKAHQYKQYFTLSTTIRLKGWVLRCDSAQLTEFVFCFHTNSTWANHQHDISNPIGQTPPPLRMSERNRRAGSWRKPLVKVRLEPSNIGEGLNVPVVYWIICLAIRTWTYYIWYGSTLTLAAIVWAITSAIGWASGIIPNAQIQRQTQGRLGRLKSLDERRRWRKTRPARRSS